MLRIKKINNDSHKIFFSADHHYYHKNVIRFCNRPFTDVYEMNKCMIDNWNSVVGKDDTIFHLGDFSFGGQKTTQIILEQLNGKKFICLGDHDKVIYTKCHNHFEAVEDMIFLTIKNQNKLYEIFMMHWLCKIWPKSHYGSWHFHGHSHSGMDQYAQKEGKILDVGVDNISKYKSNFYGPISFEEVQKIMITKPNNFNLAKRNNK